MSAIPPSVNREEASGVQRTGITQSKAAQFSVSGPIGNANVKGNRALELSSDDEYVNFALV